MDRTGICGVSEWCEYQLGGRCDGQEEKSTVVIIWMPPVVYCWMWRIPNNDTA